MRFAGLLALVFALVALPALHVDVVLERFVPLDAAVILALVVTPGHT